MLKNQLKIMIDMCDVYVLYYRCCRYAAQSFVAQFLGGKYQKKGE